MFFYASLLGILTSINASGMSDYMEYSGASGTQHGNIERDDPDYHKTNSYIPHLPRITGFIGTHGTYRFLSVVEQTAIFIGEGKHGMWRVQDNGFIREYRKKGKKGFKIPNPDPNAENLNGENMDMIKNNYSSSIPEEGSSGYKYPDQRISDGKYDNMKSYLNYIDLSIYHEKYNHAYDDHVPIDLPFFYCTMSQDYYPHLRKVWKYVLAQPQGNKIGPLGKRAGLDIKENFLNVLRFDLFPDAGIWVNIGVGDEETDMQGGTLHELKNKNQTVKYQRIDLSKTSHEIYLTERLFFNQPYIFIVLIIENKDAKKEFSYVRPSGAYWNHLVRKNKSIEVNNTVENHFPKVHVEGAINGNVILKKIYGLPVYGHHHPHRRLFGLSGGACPQRGGDYGRYPWSNSGAAFPTNYEEITPICDAVLLDVKCWINLSGQTWNDPQMFLGNAGFPNSTVVDFYTDQNVYGRYTDPYLTKLNKSNPYLMKLGKGLVKFNETKPKQIIVRMNFTTYGKYLLMNDVTIEKENAGKDDGTNCSYILIGLASVLLLINIVAIITCVIMHKKGRKKNVIPNRSNDRVHTDSKAVRSYSNSVVKD